jgi:O-antigen/teichoic acid export membrane protein
MALNGGLQTLTLLSSGLLVIALARYSSPEVLGLYGLTVSVVAVTAFLLQLEYHQFTRRELIVASRERWPVIIRDQAVLHTVVLVVMLPLVFLLFRSGVMSFLPRRVHGWYLALIVSEIFAQEAALTLIATSRLFKSNVVMFLRQGLWALLLVIFAVTGHNLGSVNILLGAWFLGGCGGILVAAVFLRDLEWAEATRKPIEWSVMLRGVRTAAPFLLTTGSSLIVLFFDRFVVASYRGLAAVGVYTFFASVTFALHTVIHNGVALFRLPRVVAAYAEGRRDGFSHEISVMAQITIGSALALGVLLAVGVFPLISVVKPVYRRELGAFYFLLGAEVLRCCADVPLYALYAMRKDSWLLAIQVATAVLSIGLSFALIPRYGVAGAGVESMIGGVFLLIVAAWALRSGLGRGAA